MEQDNGTKQNISYQAVDPENQTADNFKLHDVLRTLAKFGLRYEDLTFMQATYLTMMLNQISVIITKTPSDIELWRDMKEFAEQAIIHLEKKPED